MACQVPFAWFWASLRLITAEEMRRPYRHNVCINGGEGEERERKRITSHETLELQRRYDISELVGPTGQNDSGVDVTKSTSTNVSTEKTNYTTQVIQQVIQTSAAQRHLCHCPLLAACTLHVHPQHHQLLQRRQSHSQCSAPVGSSSFAEKLACSIILTRSNYSNV